MRLLLLLSCLTALGGDCRVNSLDKPAVETTTAAPDMELPPGPDSLSAQHVKGLSFVAPPRPFEGRPMDDVTAVGANWIAAIPYAFTRLGQPRVSFDHSGQWWGERPEGVEETIRRAHAAGVEVMLKPQVYVPRSWPGDIDFATDAEWEQWETDYRNYLDIFVDLAVAYELPLFCIGTEFKQSATQREAFWRTLIADIRRRYTGKLVYAANWDDYQNVPFWDALDYVGIDAYFPLDANDTPTKQALLRAWQEPVRAVRAFHERVQRPVLFTEWGYLSVDGAAGKTWELEKRVQQLPINEAAQTVAYEAFFEVWSREPYWRGGFLWKWFPGMRGHEGYPARDYTPQGKQAEATLGKWFGQ